jgi:peptidyl-prolyl cis-trans isomerase SDCCAG10
LINKMSSTYVNEPVPTSKVILKTTTGDLTLELFAKQCPEAVRNFLQHCLDGYYNNTIFHRLVPNFILQGGDPSGTGAGGESAINHGEGFGDEIHSRLKFNRRGLLGMAKSADEKYGSQFFLTLGSGPEVQGLTGRCTMFGRVEGDTIYNLMKMADAEMTEEGGERPLYPTKITGAEILVNPFEDMAARVLEAPRTKEEGTRKDMKKRKKPAGKNVMSFGGDEEEEIAAPVLKRTKANPKLVFVEEGGPDKLNSTNMAKGHRLEQQKARVLSERSPADEDVETNVRAVPATLPVHKPTDDLESEDDEPEQAQNRSALERANAEIAALKASMRRTIGVATAKQERPKSALEAMIPPTSSRGRKRGKVSDERGALDMFKAFKQRLDDLPSGTEPESNGKHYTATDKAAITGDAARPTTTGDDDEEAALCDLHFIANCQSCKSWDEDKPDGEANADGEDDPTWMAHSLTFAKDTLGKDLEWKKKMAEIEVIDPREKARTIKEEKRREKGGSKGGTRGKAKV